METMLEKIERIHLIGIGGIGMSAIAQVLLEQGYAAGCVDFLRKPIKPTVLLAKVKVFLELDARQQQLAFVLYQQPRQL